MFSFLRYSSISFPTLHPSEILLWEDRVGASPLTFPRGNVDIGNHVGQWSPVLLGGKVAVSPSFWGGQTAAREVLVRLGHH